MKLTHIVGLNGICCFRFNTTVPSGQGSRSIGIEVEPEVLKKLVAIMEHTSSVGHAVYHYYNPSFALPCDGCSLVD